jgi:ribosomal protein S7
MRTTKKTATALLFILALCSSQANAQFFKKLKEKLDEASQQQNSSSSSTSSFGYKEPAKIKSDLTFLGKYNSLTIRGKSTYDVAPIFEVEITDDSRKNDDGTISLFLGTEYTENGRTGRGEYFRREITKDQVYFDDNGNEKFLMKIDNNTLVVVQLDKKTWDRLTINDCIMMEIWSKDKSVLEKIKAKGTPYKYTEDAVLTSYIQKALDLNKTKESAKDADRLAEHEQLFKYAELPPVSKFQPASVKKALPEVIKKSMAKYRPQEEILYYYIGFKTGVSVEDNWNLVKEARRNDLGLDKIVTKRCVTAIVVSKNTRGEYYYNFFQVYEDAVLGVMDGSKFTGEYYTNAIGGPYGLAKANAMANKGK